MARGSSVSAGTTARRHVDRLRGLLQALDQRIRRRRPFVRLDREHLQEQFDQPGRASRRRRPAGHAAGRHC